MCEEEEKGELRVVVAVDEDVVLKAEFRVFFAVVFLFSFRLISVFHCFSLFFNLCQTTSKSITIGFHCSLIYRTFWMNSNMIRRIHGTAKEPDF